MARVKGSVSRASNEVLISGENLPENALVGVYRPGKSMQDTLRRTFALSLLGRFEMSGPEGGVAFASKKAAGLLAYLACEADKPQRREQLTALLWEAHLDEQARQNLRQALYVLRSILGDDSIVTANGALALRPGIVNCDVPRFEALVREGSRDALAAATELHKGPLLAGFDIAADTWNEWLARERRRLQEQSLDAMVRLGELELAAPNAENALKAADRAIAENNVREDAHRLRMRALAAGGRRPDALRHYDDLVALLRDELDIEPDATTKALARDLRKPQQSETITTIPEERRPLALPDRPSIAVLPFANVSGEADQDHLADGISEDLITSLARIRWLFVIGRNSSFVYKHRAVDVKDVSRELGVRYVLEGSVRRAGRQLRISAQLIDAVTGGQHWAEKYDRKLGDLFAVQDEITRSVAGAIEPRLLAAEGLRALARSAADLDAWDQVARAQAHFWRLTPADHKAAIAILEPVVAAHPDYAPALGLLGFRLVFAVHMGWVDHAHGLRAGLQHAARAIALDDCDPWGQIALGYGAMMERRTEDSIAAFQRAVNLNPNSASAHAYLGHIFAFSGQHREAITHLKEAIRLSPLDPEMAFFLGGMAVANYTASHFTEAARWTTEALRLRPGFQGAQRLRCASLAQAGRIDEAKALLAIVRREQPQLSLDWIRASVPYQTQQLVEHFLDGIRKAGLNAD